MNTLVAFAWAMMMTAVLSQERSCGAGAGIYKFNLTRWEGYVLYDGPLGTLSNFFSVPDFVLLRSFRYYYGDAAFRGAQNVVVLKNQNDVVIFDTGSGPSAVASGTGGQLIPHLKAIGIAPKDVTKVFLTHAHFDHAAGLLSPTGGMAFPNALVYLHVAEDKFARMPAAKLRKMYPMLVPFVIDAITMFYPAIARVYSGKIRLLNHLQDMGGIKAIHVPGHTPGHTVYRIDDEFLVTGDALLTRTTGIQHPDWNILSDTNRTQAVANRIKLLDSLAKEPKIKTHLYHEGFPGIGRIIQDRAAFDFNALALILPL